MSQHIYHGPWINWSKGGLIRGATLTLPDNDGGLLTSFIATFVAIVGAQGWKILSYAVHQMRSTPVPKDGLYHQQQAVWRNVQLPGGAAWVFLQQAWFWRNKTNQALQRTLCWALFAIIYLFIFGLAAVYSSEISKAPGTERLVASDNCGYWSLKNDLNDDTLKAWRARLLNTTQISASYARACYGGSFDALQCGRYPTPAISSTYYANASCPFKSNLCYWGNSAAYEMTSKLIDSQDDLGINTPPSQRLQYQKRTTCAPLNSTGYVNVFNQTVNDGGGKTYNNSWVQIRFGPGVDDGENFLNYTDEVSTRAYNDLVGYQLSTQMSYANRSGSVSWKPIPALFRDNADTVLLFLKGNAMRLTAQCEDPWFSAHWKHPINGSVTYYGYDQWIATVGCTEQYRICNPNNDTCTPYLGAQQAFASLMRNDTSISSIGLDDMQLDIAGRIFYGMTYSSIYYMVNPRGGMALRAQETAMQLEQLDLPANQWQIELRSWFDGGLAAVQQRVLEYATGPTNINSGSYIRSYHQNADEDGQRHKYLCRNQVINDSSGTMSFSILGMAILFVVGGLILITSLVIDRIVGFFQLRFKLNLHGHRAWILDDKLQMQRQIFEGAGMGVWRLGEDDSIPVTVRNEKWPRFADDGRLFSPNTPDTPDDSHLYARTEYMGAEMTKGPQVHTHMYMQNTGYQH